MLVMCDYTHRTADTALFSQGDPVYPFEHVFMSQVPDKRTGPRRDFHFPAGPSTCSRWMTRIGIDARFKGGSVRMTVASAAIVCGTHRCRSQHGQMDQLDRVQQLLQPVST